MYSAPNCPICGQELDYDYYTDYEVGTDFGDGYIKIICHGTCTNCEKQYEWIETYLYNDYSQLKEIKNDDD